MEKISSQERIVVEIEIMSGNQAFGLTNRELAKLAGTSESNACRDLAIFKKHGWVEYSQLDGRIRLSPAFGKISNDMTKGFKTAKLKLSETEARYASEMQ
jgi:DNA-binding IclR family transcriptional regulator